MTQSDKVLGTNADSGSQMTVTSKQLKGSYSEGEAMALYNKVRQTGEWLAFLKSFLHDEDYQVARNALWVLTKATDLELASLQPMLHELIDTAMSEVNSSVRRLSMNIIVRLKMEEDDLRTDFLDFCLDKAVTGVKNVIYALCLALLLSGRGTLLTAEVDFEMVVEGMRIAVADVEGHAGVLDEELANIVLDA